MDTTVTSNTTFIHHSDLSGDVRIRRKDNGQEIAIPGDDLRRFLTHGHHRLIEDEVRRRVRLWLDGEE